MDQGQSETPAAEGQPARLPVVAIIGRPNVGKSALFNRIARRRLAIVHHEWGITRDRLATEVEWEGRHFELQDTCGVAFPAGAHPSDELALAAHRQVESAIKEADALVLVVDINHLAPLDLEVADLARRSGKPVVVAANKADNPEREHLLSQIEELGFPTLAVSALHGRGIPALLDEIARRLPPAPAGAASRAPALKVAVVGRPNAGKSSYINRLLGQERMVVSSIPGTTRDAVEIPFSIGDSAESRHYCLIDTAGMRKRGKARTAVEKFSLLRTERAIARADIVILVIDALAGPHKQDKKVLHMIDSGGKAGLILVNKWDLVAGVSPREYEEGLRHYIPFASYLPVLFVSALTGHNIDESMEALDFVAGQLDARIGTAILNRVAHEAVERNRPVFPDGRPFKLYYAVQTGQRPPRFTFFVNRTRGLPSNYEAYMEHCLRRAFGFEGVAIQLSFTPHHPESGPR